METLQQTTIWKLPYSRLNRKDWESAMYCIYGDKPVKNSIKIETLVETSCETEGRQKQENVWYKEVGLPVYIINPSKKLKCHN